MSGLALGSTPAQRRARLNACEIPMTWKAPKAVEVSVAMEINIYACASRK
jgi:coenzyme PQQ precursor peptide PqqA